MADITEALYRLIVAVRDHEIQGNPYGNSTYELASRALLEAIGRDPEAWMDAPEVYNRVVINSDVNSLRDWKFHHELLFANARYPETYNVYKGFLIVTQRRNDDVRVSDYRTIIFQHRGSDRSALQVHSFWSKTPQAGLSYAREQIDQYLLEDELFLQE